jgi:arylsulfatase A-like enzyme
LGIYGEHATADAITPRIPMIVRWPGLQRGHVDAGLHYNLDLAPTLADLLGQEPQPAWDGQTYAPALRDGADCGRPELILSQCAHVCQRGVRWDDWMYVRTYHDGYHLFPQEMLFNVADDPHEQTDLAAARPDLCADAAHRLLGWHDAMMATQQDAVDPLWTVMREGGPFHTRGHLRQYAEHLKQTDRAWAVEELRKRHPGEA